jgi:predicted phage tail component-like protein
MRYFYLNDIDSRAYGYVLSVERPLLMDLDTAQVKIPKRAGVYVPKNSDHRSESALVITVRFGLLGSNRSDFRASIRAFAKFLYDQNKTGEAAGLWFSDETKKIYYVYLDGGFDLEEIANTGEVTLNFIAPTPYAHASSERIAYSEADSITVTNNGTVETYPRYRIQFTEAYTGDITMDKDGDTITLINANIAAWDIIWLDTEKLEAYNETTDTNLMPIVTMDSDFKPFEPETTHTINFTPAGGVAGFRAYFTERFL